MIIGVDVDLTLVSSDIPWYEYLDKVCGVNRTQKLLKNIAQNVELPYNTLSLYPEIAETGVDGYDFWENNFLYDTMRPIVGSVAALKELKTRGHTLRIVSKTMKGHYSSKVRFIKRFFPFIELDGKSNDAFVATHEKFSVKMDALVDDRLASFRRLPDEVLKVQFKTCYTQDCEIPVDLVSNDWEKIKNFIISME